MINFTISHIGVYTKPEKSTQRIYCPWISFNVSGLKYNSLYHSDGRLISEEKLGSPPFFRVCLPGMTSKFEYTKGRENWVIMFRDIPLRYSDVSDTIEIRDGRDWIPIPLSTNVPEEMVPGWQSELKRIQTSFYDPVPRNRLIAKLGILNIIRYMIDESPINTIGESPAEKLKRLIDEDNSFSKSLSELSEACSYSRDHLRILFQKRYQINPGQYRNEKRMAIVMDYISNSILSVKEITEKTGFEYPSHLSIAFRKTYNMTPGEAIRRYRYRVNS